MKRPDILKGAFQRAHQFAVNRVERRVDFALADLKGAGVQGHAVEFLREFRHGRVSADPHGLHNRPGAGKLLLEVRFPARGRFFPSFNGPDHVFQFLAVRYGQSSHIVLPLETPGP